MSALKTVSWLFKLIMKLADIRILYTQIKENPESKKVSTVLGMKGLGYIVGFIICAFISVLGTIYFAKMYGTLAFLVGIVGIITCVSLLIISTQLLLLALSCTIKQLKLNRKFIGFLDLFLLIATIVVLGIVVSNMLGALDAQIAANNSTSK